MKSLAVITVLLGLAGTIFAGEVRTVSPTEKEDCAYRVQPGEDLGTILVRLGVEVVWGPKGAIREVLQRNREVVRKNGDFLLPDTLIHIPKQLLGDGKVGCPAVAQERDESKRMQLYALAEKKILSGKYERVCRAFVELAEMPAQSQDRERILHFAALCEYQNNDWASAHKLWMKVLRFTHEPDLKLRASYNLALIECQRDRAAKGYERLGHLDPSVLFHEAEFEQRAFVMLVEYCAEKAGGSDARVAALKWLSESAGSATIRDFAKTREQGLQPNLIASSTPTQDMPASDQAKPSPPIYRRAPGYIYLSPTPPRAPASE